MYKNYLKTALRYLKKNSVFSVINIMGLTLGFTCFILLGLFVSDELSFDKFHSDFSDIYRVIQTIKEKDGHTRQVGDIAPLIGTEAKAQFPEVKDQTRLIQIGRLTVGNDPSNRDYEVIWIADPDFFQFFDFKCLYGDPLSALTRPDNIVITESIARKYFGKTNVVGQSLYTNVYQATVGAVIKDFPENSHIKMNIIHTQATWSREIKSWDKFISGNWTSNSFITYLKMTPGFDKKAFEQKLTKLVTGNYTDDIEYSSTFTLQPLSDIHLYSKNIEGAMNVNAGNPLYVYMFSIVGFLILVIACFNYMNLSTAAGSRRTREVAMRKTLGAVKNQLILQFSSEALLLSILSLLLSIALIFIILPYINSYTGKDLKLSLNDIPLIATLLSIVLAFGVLSALYPAFFLSKINPVKAFKKEVKIGGGKFSLRKILVISQFTVSIIMIAATIIIYCQLNYLQNKKLGFDVDNLLVVDINSGKLRHQFESIKQAFETLSSVKSVTVSSRVPGEWKVFPVAYVKDPETENKSLMTFVGADKDFLKTFNIKLVDGRNLTNDVSDSNSVLVSESAVRALSLKNPVGKIVDITGTMWAGDFAKQDHKYLPRIAGIVKDFYFQSFREERKPIMIASYRNPIHKIDYYTLKIHTNNWSQTISDLKNINNHFDPENPMEYTFLDNRFAEFYKADQTRGLLFLIFSGIIIFIACMGLFALASFSVKNRTKEIGIRKLLGASISQIAMLLSGEFTGSLSLAFIISIPVTYWTVENWLREFAYHIPVPWWAFLLAGLIAFCTALATISYQTIRAAITNPVESLRYE